MISNSPSSRPTFTPQQQRAMELRTCSVSLSAGAGCGKTFVLTERFLSHLDPVQDFADLRAGQGKAAELHQLIAITFTERAAREMRSRIRSKSLDRLMNAAEEDAPYWLELLRSLDGARISTFHAFCAALLRSHSVEAELDPRFEIIEETQASTMLAEACDDVLRSLLTSRDEDMTELALQYDLYGVKNHVMAMVGSAREHKLDEWLTLSPNDLVMRWESFYKKQTVSHVKGAIFESAEYKRWIEFVPNVTDAQPAVMSRCQEILDLDAHLSKSRDPLARLDDLRKLTMITGLTKTKFADQTQYEKFKEYSVAVREVIDDHRDLANFDPDSAKRTAEMGLRILRIAARIIAAFNERKTEHNGLDFTDLQLRTRDLLTDPKNRELQERISKNIRLLLVDECQDTDPIQVSIIKALCGDGLQDGKLFFVGDYKQSIYRFRGADPEVFVGLREGTPQQGRLPLSENFRSQPAILHFVNALFCDTLSSSNEHYEPLQPRRPQVTREPAIEFLWHTPSDDKKLSVDERRQHEARWLAKRLRQLIDSGEPIVSDHDPLSPTYKKSRALRFGDIAILFSALSNVPAYEAALRELDIPYYLVGGHAFYAQQEIYDLLNLLRTIQSPADEVSLAGVLRSPIFGFDDETLFWLARKTNGLSSGLFAKELPVEMTNSQRDRVRRAAAVIGELRTIKDRVPIADLINRALELTGYDAALLAEFMGERKLANLGKLIDMARTFDRSSTLCLADFLVQLSDFVAQEPKEAMAATHPENTDVVKIMSIHKSKGLEFPMVVLPDVDRKMNHSSVGAMFDPELGPLVKLVVPSDADGIDQSTNATCVGFDLKKIERTELDREERVRLFYVATTRAADYLLISGSVDPDFLKFQNPASKLLAERFDVRSGELIAELPDGYAEPKIRVTLAEPAIDYKPVGSTVISTQTVLEQLGAIPKKRRDVAPEQPDPLEILRVAPIAPDRSARRRFSVSRLNGELAALRELAEAAEDEEGETYEVPSSLAMTWGESAADLMGLANDLNVAEIDVAKLDVNYDPTTLGTLVHEVLAKVAVRLSKRVPASELLKQLPRWIDRSAEALELDDPALIKRANELARRFLESSRAAECSKAKSVRAEVEFILPVKMNESSKSSEQDNCYLQGFLDLLYQDEAGQWGIVDYKTSLVREANYDELVKQYEPQMMIYALAVEQTIGAAPTNVVLHFLTTGQEYRYTWNEAKRKQTKAWLVKAVRANREGE